MECAGCSLHYASPAHGGWGVVRIGMLVPESRQLFVSPAACGRHGAIGALQQGLKGRLSYLYLEQSDIIEGYEDAIVEAMPDFLASIERRPKAILVFVSCLDDLIGTDLDSLKQRLGERYTDIDFQICHMNPISSDSPSPPGVTIQTSIYGLLHRRGKVRNAVNCIGNLEAFSDASELPALLRSVGFEVQHITECRTYEAYQTMAESKLDLVTMVNGLPAARAMERQLGIPHLFAPTAYALDEIDDAYKALERALDVVFPDTCLVSHRKKAVEAIEHALEVVGKRPIIVADSATTRPFSLAKALSEYGFSIQAVFSQQCSTREQPSRDWLLAHVPGLRFYEPLDHRMIAGLPDMEECICIGIEAAYITRSRHPVDLENDSGLYGYGGVCRLMDEILRAAIQPQSVRTLIDSYALVI